jgi:2-keto-3-deoxy-L-rhamnonate aldolase RhmA
LINRVPLQDTPVNVRRGSVCAVAAAVSYSAGLAGCGAAPSGAHEAEAAAVAEPSGRIIELLAAGEPVFGIFSGEHTPEQGASIAAMPDVDFVFYSLETGPFDIPALQAYLGAMQEAAEEAGVTPHELVLRVPPITEEETTRDQVRQALDVGVSGIVFPHVITAEQARTSVTALGDRLWPANSEGDLVNIVIVEDPEAIDRVREIARTPGLTVVFPGPGDLRRAFDGDMVAVENAIQAVLSACKEFEVPCGITAGAHDIAERLEQGFQVFIVSQPEALAAGRSASGR